MSNYGTVPPANMASESDGLLDGTSKHFVWDPRVQRHRWKETLLYLMPMFMSSCSIALFDAAWSGDDSGNSFKYGTWIGFGAALGGFIGRLLKMFIVRKESTFSLQSEVDESVVIALSLWFGPGGSFFWEIYYAENDGMTFTQGFFFVAALSFLFMLGMPFLFRGIIHAMRGTRVFTCLQTSLEFTHDVTLSLAVGFGYAFMLGTTDRLEGSWFPGMEVTDATPVAVSMLTYGFLFAMGFLLVQIVQNSVLPHTWSDLDN